MNEHSAHIKYLEQRVEALATELIGLKAGIDLHRAAATEMKKETYELQLVDDSEGSLRPAIAEKPPDETGS